MLPEESYYLVLGERLAAGAQLYSEAWHAGPPLLAWFYGAMTTVFGQGTWLAVRIFACCYVYLVATYFIGTLVEYKLFRANIVLGAALMAMMLSSPWYLQTFDAPLAALLPVAVAFRALLQLGERPQTNNRLLFQAGIAMALAMLLLYKAFFLFVGFVLAYFFLRSPRRSELAALAGGIVLVSGGLALLLFFRQTLAASLDQGLLYYFDRIGFSGHALYPYDPTLVVQGLLPAWALFGVLGVAGFVHFRLRIFSYVVKVRATETAMALWLGSVLVALLFKVNRLEIKDFLLLSPPLLFYTLQGLEMGWTRRLRLPLLLLGLAPAAIIYLHAWGLLFPEQINWASPKADDRWLHGDCWEEIHALPDRLAPLPRTVSDVWVLDHQPAWYLLLDLPPALGYTDFRMFYFKFGLWEEAQAKRLRSRPISPSDFYRTLAAHPPAMILDPTGKFPLLQWRFPLLLQDYRLHRNGSLDYYLREERRDVVKRE